MKDAVVVPSKNNHSDRSILAERIRRTATPGLVWLYSSLIYGLPILIVTEVLSGIHASGSWMAFSAAMIVSPLLFSVTFAGVAGVLSRPHQKAIVPGRFPRDVGHAVYFHRRLYGLCWTCLYYFKPVYYLVLTLPALKWLTFRAFGYKGSMQFTIYPDTWIRDLPLLNFEPGAYIANRATIGTNLALSDGSIMVDRISVGKNAVIGHLVAIAPGCTFEEGVEIGSVTAIGYRSHFAAGANVQPRCAVEHGVRIGTGAFVGASTYVGSASRVADGAIVTAGSVILPRTRTDGSAHAR